MISDSFVKAVSYVVGCFIGLFILLLIFVIYQSFDNEAEEFYEEYQQKLEECQKDLPRNQECKLVVIKPNKE